MTDNGTPALSDTNSFTLTVNEVNVAPVLTVPASQTISELVAFSANATATDADLPAQTLTFALVERADRIDGVAGGRDCLDTDRSPRSRHVSGAGQGDRQRHAGFECDQQLHPHGQ